MRSKVDPNETPRQRFVRLCNARVSILLKRFNVLAHLADRRRYEFSQGDVDKIQNVLQQKLDYVIGKFREQSKEKSSEDEFRLES